MVGNAPGQVSGARTVDDAVGLEHRVDPLVVPHVELHGPLLDRETKDVGTGLERRDVELGLGDLGLELCLLRLGGRDLVGEVGCLSARGVESFLSERERIAFGLVIGHDPTRCDGSRRRRESDEGDESHKGWGRRFFMWSASAGAARSGPALGYRPRGGSCLSVATRTRRDRGGWP